MNILMIGTGYVGLISGLGFAEFGFKVTCFDKDQTRMNLLKGGKIPFYEPGLKDMFDKHYKTTKKLIISTDIKKIAAKANVIFITVGTPTRRIDNEADLSSVFSVADEISKYIKKYCVIITKSTVPVGTSRKIKNIISKNVKKNMFDVASNPEFLREGSAINDFMRPDRVVIGVESKRSEKILKSLYRPLYLTETPIVTTTIETAEIIKYASNSFLATKIAFINEVSNLCEKVGANVQDVSKAMGLDKRIGSKFLHVGPGFGGSCFPKDVKAFSTTAKNNKIALSIVNAVNLSNQKRPKILANTIIKYFKNKIRNKNFALLGLSFKPNTDDIRFSTSIIIGNLLIKAGARIHAYDPKAMKNTKKQYPKYIFTNSSYSACEKSDAIIIATEWNEFRALNLKKIRKIIKKPIMFDLRNIYDPDEMKEAGWEYISLGR